MADFNLSAEVSMDVDPLKASKTTIERNLKAINKSLRDQRKEFKQNEASAESLAKQEADLGRAVKLQEGLLKQRNKTLDEMQRQMKQSNQVTDEQKIKLQNASRAVQQAENQLNGYENELKQTQAQQKLLGRSTDTVKNSLGQLRNEAKLTEMRFKQSEKSVSGYKNRLTELSHTMQKQKAHTDLLKGNLRELERVQQGNSREAKGLRNDIIKEALAFQVLQGRIDETTDELKEYQRQQRLMGTATRAWEGARDSMDRIATTLRSLGELTQGIVGGVMTTHFSALVPILGSIVSLGAGLGGMLVASAGGAIGMGGAFGIAGIAVQAFAGQATYALKMLEDGQLRVTNEVTAYQTALDRLKTSWEGLIAQNQAAIFNTMTNGINTARFALNTLNPFLTKTATQIETASGKMLDWAKNSANAKKAFDILNTQGPKIFQHLLNATQSFVNGSTALFNKLSPLYGWAAKGFANMAKSFDNWANSVQGSKAINGFIEYTKTNLPIVGSIFGNVFKGIISLFQAFSGHSHNVLVGIKNVTKGFAEWSEGLKKSDGFKQFVQYLEVNGPKVWTLIKNITSTLWGLAKGMAPVGAAVLSMSGAFFKWTATMTNAHPIIGKILGIMTALGGVTLLAAKPILLLRGALLGATGATKLFGNAGAIAALKTKLVTAATKVWTVVSKGAALATRGLGLAIRFMTGPIGIVITAVGLLVAGITHLWRTNATFRNIVMSVWQAVQTKIMSVVGSITSIIRNNIPLIKGIFSNTFNGVRNIVNGSLNIVLGITKVFSGLFTGNFRKMWSGVQQIFSGFIRVIKGIFQASFVGQIVRLAVIMGTKIKGTFSNLGKVSRAIFSALGTWMSKKWTSIKDNTVGKAKLLWSGVKAWWSNLGKNTRTTMSSIGSFMSKKWQSIKSGTVNKAKSTWSGVKNWWSNLNKNTRATMSSVGKFMSSKWSSIKSNTVSRAKNTWSGVKGAWGSLSKGTRNTMNSVGGFMSKKWRGIKNSTVNLVTGMKNQVTGVMNKMGDVIKSVTGKIKGFFSGMIGKVKSGLNKLIEGVNFVGKKLGMDKIDPVNFHTGTTHTQTNLVKNGKISQDTMATVGDKGKGNGPGGFRHETIIPPKGKPFITPNRDTTMPISKGTAIMNGAQTHAMLSNSNPEFASGTIPRFAKGTKKDKNVGDYLNDIKSGTKDKASDAYHGVKDNTQKALEASGKAIGKGKKWLGDAVGDVMDWIDKPGKLFDKIIEGLGLNMSSFGIPKSASLPFDMMKGMFGKLKKAAIDLITGWMEDAAGGEGDASWLLKHDIWQKFGAYTGGLGFNGGKHYGVDFGMKPGTPVKAVAGGKVSRVWNDYGGGKSMEIDLGGGLTNWYMHLNKQLKKKGDKVGVGDLIAKSGNTGNYTAGSGHLHFQLNKNGKPQANVLEWLKGLGGSGSKSANKWKGDIKKAAKATGTKLSGGKLNDIVKLIATESNGNPKAVQGGYTDVNTGGNEARGLLQYTPGTWGGYKTKNGGNIMNGYHQLKAFFNNSNWSRDLAAWKSRMARGQTGWGPTGSRRGYANGTNNARRGFNQVFEEGGEIMQMRGGETVIPNDVSIQAFKQIASSDIFNRTQTAVYDAISQYADQLREKQQAATREQMELQRLSQANVDIQEQNSILKEMLYTMQDLLTSSRNNERHNAQTAGKDMTLDGKKVTKSVNRQQGKDTVSAMFNMGGGLT